MMPRDTALTLLSIALVICGVFFGGYQYAATTYGKQMAELKERYALAESVRSTAEAMKLREKDQIADKLTAELAETKNRAAQEREELQRQIDEALKKDGPTYSGLGPGGLCIYRRALGYPCDAAD